MGHEQASTTLTRYTHTPDGYDQRVLAAFKSPADFSPTSEDPPRTDESEKPAVTVVEVLAAYSHSAHVADLRICHTMALTTHGVCPETEREASVEPARPP